MPANGPAIKGVALPDDASGQVPSIRISHEAVTVQGGYGAVFAVMVQILLNITSVAVQCLSEPRIYPRLQI